MIPFAPGQFCTFEAAEAYAATCLQVMEAPRKTAPAKAFSVGIIAESNNLQHSPFREKIVVPEGAKRHCRYRGGSDHHAGRKPAYKNHRSPKLVTKLIA